MPLLRDVFKVKAWTKKEQAKNHRNQATRITMAKSLALADMSKKEKKHLKS